MAYYSRGLALASKGEKRKAIEDFSRAIRLNPKKSNWYYDRAHCWSELGNQDKVTTPRSLYQGE